MSPCQTSPARRVALQVLLELDRGTSAGSDELLDRAINRAGLEETDARLATALVLSVLRHQLWLDARYRQFLTKSPSRLSLELRSLLRLAAAQRLLFDRIPQHAIANESTALARELLKLRPRDVAFANAVARRIAEMDLPSPRTVLVAGDEPQVRAEHCDMSLETVQALSVDYSHPPWLVEFLIARYDLADARRVLAANNLDPPAVVRANRMHVTREQLCAEFGRLGISSRPGSLAPDSVVLEGTGALVSALRSDLFRRGLFYVQDEASQLVSVIASPHAGERILDLCAAPGGKSTHLAEISGGRAIVTATDLSPERLRSVVENAARLQSASLEITSIEEVREREACHDLVLVDAPCSGLGTIRRNPEIRYRITRDALERLAARQLEILCEAARLVLPGGRVVYSTCSISDEENAGVVRRFLAGNPGFRIVKSRSLSAAGLQQADGFYRTWPAHLEMDGFEVAVLARTDQSVS